MVRESIEWFLKVSETAKEKWLPYMWYRIGKMYAAGQGTEKNYEEAAAWFERAVEKKHNFAQYALAGQYLNGQGVEKDERKALQLYECAKSRGIHMLDMKRENVPGWDRDRSG